MKIKSISFHDAGEEGVNILASFAIPRANRIDAELAAALTQAFEEVCGQFGGEKSVIAGTYRPDEKYSEVSRDTPTEPEAETGHGEPAPEPTRRRRGGAAEEAPAEAEANPPTRRRRGNAEAAVSENADAQSAAGDGDAASADASTAETTSPSEETSSRRRGGKAPASDAISDADLSKAASAAAAEIGPNRVKEVVANFGVGNLAELPQDQRREFLDTLKAEVA